MAGGRSSRFGSDKARAEHRGRTLLDHAMAAIRPYVAETVVCGRSMADGSGIADRPMPYMGPLGGVNAALRHAAAEGFDGVLTTGCDMPRFPPELARALIGTGPAYLAGQQLIGYWPSHLANALDRHLIHQGNRSIRSWLDTLDARVVTLSAPLPNINRPEDLAALRD